MCLYNALTRIANSPGMTDILSNKCMYSAATKVSQVGSFGFAFFASTACRSIYIHHFLCNFSHYKLFFINGPEETTRNFRVFARRSRVRGPPWHILTATAASSSSFEPNSDTVGYFVFLLQYTFIFVGSITNSFCTVMIVTIRKK